MTPEADASCPALMSTLPLELAGEPSRRVQSDSPYAYAWGDPAIVLVCGVDRPAGYVAGASAIQINGVQWYVDTDDPDTTVWTTVDRPVYVQISLPASVDSAPVTALTPQIAQALPYRDPQPGPLSGHGGSRSSCSSTTARTSSSAARSESATDVTETLNGP